MPENVKPNRCVIICASPEFHLASLRADDYIIACDGGYEHAVRSGVRPHLVLGDFDSYAGEVAGDIPTLRAPCEKDDTDTMLAIKLALEEGYRNFLLLGATGGRLDHMLANISAAVYIAGHGGSCVIEDRFNRVHVLRDGSLTLRGLKGQTLSVLSYTDEAQGVTLTGMKYPAKDYTMTSAFPIGVSNVVQSDECSVTVKRGVLLVIEEGVR